MTVAGSNKPWLISFCITILKLLAGGSATSPQGCRERDLAI